MNHNPTSQPRRLALFAMLFVFLTGILIPGAGAEDLSAVKERMSKRLSAVDKLKAEGKAGEANTGFLASRAPMTPVETALMKAENADRKVVYAAIAEGKKATPASVGALRAASLRKTSAQGVWLQDPKGKWYKKS